jgi:methyltransferase (TIGR00027 family)
MRDAQPSTTAQRVALRRAAHQLLDVPPVFADPLALHVIGQASARALRADPHHFDRRQFSRFLRAFLAVRSRVAEDALARGVARGVRQYVVLGAGLDTFAYRNPYPPDVLRVFEVDAPATQAWKRQRLEDEAIPVPSTLTFVPVDFERQSLADELRGAGLDLSFPTVFAWLGVVPYLTRPSFEATLAFVAAATARGGGVVFDYASPPHTLTWPQRLVLRAMAARVAAVGEPFQTFFETPPLVDHLQALGFDEIESLDGDALNRRYFDGRSDGLHVGHLGRIMTAFRGVERQPTVRYAF